ncbi:CREB3 regulatory factor isoform X1 [Hemiscyllium ocellatum]|uniref:CREB3 regulatory factor isoform X1 n=1 Tax=Hemiscyllium ocellatum TaxID=170820 RepID=UPI002966301E|nr:CREB3 regulatory factor isoform X1 [Hemiscyllium ocellatum]XP_060692730.1 CREB3 regulatory factor isoform X1 [Hemiscyllium ocellatum]
MPQPSVSGMDPPFGDAFCNRPFPDQVLTSTDLLGNNSDPDFMYELDREMTYTHSSRDDPLTLGDCKDLELLEPLNELLDSDPSYTSNWEQWDTCWEDLTKYTKLTSYDIWGTKEVDFLGLDDFSSPYQNEDVISRTPTLAQLNCEDSQPVLDSLYHPDLLKSLNQNSLTSSLAGKKLAANRAMPLVSSARSPCIDACLPETTQKLGKSVSSSATVDNGNTNQPLNTKIGPVLVDNKDFVKKAKVWINPVPLGKSTLGATQVHSDLPDDSCCSDSGANVRKLEKKNVESTYSNKVPTVFKEANDPSTRTETIEILSPSVPDHTQKKEEHNYSLFISDSLNEQSPSIEQEVEDDDDDDDEDHDEGFGSEHEYSDNEEDDDDDDDEEEEEEDKDDDVSDTFSEPGFENDTVDDVKDALTGISRKRSKRRYFWEYSEQLMPPPKQDRMLKPSEWDRDTLPSNMYQKNGLHHGKYLVKKSRRTDVEDLTPNPRKLLQIGNELRKLNKVISDLTPVSELPLTARPRSRKEKNKLASRACRLKKKAQYEANKVKLWGLNTEYDHLLYVINSIKQEIVNRVQRQGEKGSGSILEKLENLLNETLGTTVAGQTSDFVNQVLEKTGEGDPTGGLEGLRVPTSKV